MKWAISQLFRRGGIGNYSKQWEGKVLEKKRDWRERSMLEGREGSGKKKLFEGRKENYSGKGYKIVITFFLKLWILLLIVKFVHLYR